MHIKVESYGKVVRTGTTKANPDKGQPGGDQYTIAEAFLVVDDAPYPVRFEYFLWDGRHVLGKGIWNVPVAATVNRNGNVDLRPDFERAYLAPTASAQGQASPKPASA